MAEDAFVRMLLVAAGGNVADERDVELAGAAATWAAEHGWRPYLGDCRGFVCGHNGLEFWVDSVTSPEALMILVRLQSGTGWKTHGRYQVAHLGHALDVLAAEGLIPGRFSTIGRRALEDHARVLERSADALEDLARVDYYATRDLAAEAQQEAKAGGLREAAASARRFAGAELAVLG